ncbi:hypothetical protein C7R92_15210 [Brevibacillus porteri]|uniref:Transposase n=1 Tax=Brevibacillus porteri TaxID=2126350 RepID=A0ABX5FP16_9BACL|nr:hypothetical protein C7R92_15210 [Brevibacillus porteri]
MFHHAVENVLGSFFVMKKSPVNGSIIDRLFHLHKVFQKKLRSFSTIFRRTKVYKQKGNSCAAYLFEPVALDTGFDMGRKTDAGRQADH